MTTGSRAAGIDQAIALLPVGMDAVHQDYVRELVTTTRLLDPQVSGLTNGAVPAASVKIRPTSRIEGDDVA